MTILVAYAPFEESRAALDEAIRLAHLSHEDLVVVGIRRRGSFGKFLMGSVTDDVLKEIDQPVLCVKEPLKGARRD